MENEIWKPVVGWEGLYEVSNHGRVKSLRSGKILAGTNLGGYIIVGLRCFGPARLERVHRLVAKAFIPNPNEYPDIDHLNMAKSDNRAENLEWVTPSENSKRAWRAGAYKDQTFSFKVSTKGEKNWHAKLTDQSVVEIRRMHANGESIRSLAGRFGLVVSSVHRIVRNKTWKHLLPKKLVD